MKRLFEGIVIVLGIALAGGAMTGLFFLIFGEEEAPFGVLVFRIAVIAGIYILMLAIGFLIYYLAGGGWKRRNQADMEAFPHVLQCPVGNYFMPAAGFMLFFLFLVIAGTHYEEYLAGLRKDGIQPQYLIPWAGVALSVVVLYVLVRKRVFYSSRALKLVPLFGRSHIYSWREIRRITYRKQKQGRICLKLFTDGRSYVLKSNVYGEGWEEFTGMLLAAAKEYHIPFCREEERRS